MSESTDRREFLRSCGRAGIGAGLTAVAAVLGARSAAAGECISAGVCGGCSRFGHCGLPQARRYHGGDAPGRRNHG